MLVAEYFEFIYDPHFMINILIRFVFISSLIYILYKYFLIDLTIKYVVKAFETHLNFYIPQIPNMNKIIPINTIITQINNIIANLESSPSGVNTTQNDNTMLIIYITMVSVITISISIILIITGGYKLFNFKHIAFDILINLVIITISQVVFFYLVYTYIDPIKIYSIFYYNFQLVDPIRQQAKNLVNLVNQITTLSASQQQLIVSIENQIAQPNLTSQALGLLIIQLQNILNAPVRQLVQQDQQGAPIEQKTTPPIISPITNSSGGIDTIINSGTTTAIYSAVIIFGILFIITAILTIINILAFYYKYKFPYFIVPLNGISIFVYGILASIFLFAFIIMLIMLLARI